MSLIGAVLAFLPLATLLTLAPGADTALVLRTALARGGRTALLVVAGINTGVVLWGVAAAVGAGALLAASPVAFRVLKIAGALYLCYLGGRMLIAWRRGGPAELTEASPAPSAAASFGTGLLTNLLNPKVGVFYLALIAQFHVDGLSPAVVGSCLALVHAAIGFAWYGVLIAFTRRAAAAFSSSRVRARLDGVCGGVLVAFGIGVLAEA